MGDIECFLQRGMNNRKTDRHTPPASSLLGYLAKRYTEKKLHPNENVLAHKCIQRGHSLYRLAWHVCIGREGSFLGIRKLHTTLPRKEYHHQEHHHHHDHFYHCLIFDLTTTCTCTVPHKRRYYPKVEALLARSKGSFFCHIVNSPRTETLRINLDFWETDHLPLP